MKKALFAGTATALITPFRNGTVDYEAYDALLERQLAQGVQALFPCGTTGEPATLTNDEWLSVIKRTVSIVHGRVPVIAGTGGNNTADVIERARAAKEAGADAQLCVTPYYNKTTQAGLIAHYSAICADHSLPVILYSVPSRTGMSIAVDTVEALSRLDGVIGLKEAGGDICRFGDIISRCGDDMPVYCGADEMTVPALSLGALGVVSVLSDLLPDKVVQMTDAWRRGDVHTAARLQLTYLPLIRLLFRQVSPIPIKAALSMLSLCSDEVRLPLTALNEQEKAALRTELVRLEIIK